MKSNQIKYCIYRQEFMRGDGKHKGIELPVHRTRQYADNFGMERKISERRTRNTSLNYPLQLFQIIYLTQRLS
jgi:hypothetical protein